MPLQIRRGTELQRQAMTVPLAAGELLYVTDDQRLYVGNGTTLGGVLITGYTNEDAQDAAAQLFTNGTHTNITFTYTDLSNKIDAALDLSNYTGTIGASAFKGTVVADDSSVLVDAVSGRIVGPVFSNVTGNLTGNVTGNVTGDTNGLHTGNVTGNVSGNLTGNVTGNLTGNVTGNTTGYHTGDVTGSIFAEDSTLLVDALSGELGNGTLLISGDSIIGGNDIVTLRSDRDEPVNVIGVTGVAVPFTAFQFVRGSNANPLSTLAGDVLGGIKFTGLRSSTQINAVAMAAEWDSTANFSDPNPASNFYIYLNNNNGGVQTLSYDWKGTLSGPKTFQCHVFADVAARAAAIASPAPGMITYLADDGGGNPKFQGYKGAPTNAWVDLG